MVAKFEKNAKMTKKVPMPFFMEFRPKSLYNKSSIPTDL